MHTWLTVRLGVAGLICSSLLASAQIPTQRALSELSLDELGQVQVITAASGYAQSLAEAPANVSVIADEQWEANGARTLHDAISVLPGVQLTKVQTGVTNNKITLRGLSGSFGQQVLVLVDGSPLNRIYDGGVPFGNRLPLLGFKRVEIVKGPGSVIFGSDAFGGVVNLVSYDAGEAPSRAFVRRGGFNTWEAGASHSLKLGESSLSVAYEYQKSDDDPAKMVRADLQSVFDQIFGTTASRTPGRFDDHYAVSSLNARWRWRVLTLDVYDWRNLGTGLGAGVAQALDPAGSAQHANTIYRLGVDLSPLARGRLDLKLTYRTESVRTLYHIFPAGTRLPIGTDGNIDFMAPVGLVLFSEGYIGAPSQKTNTYSANLTHVLDWGDQHRVRWEIGFDRMQLDTSESKNFGPSVIDGTQPVVGGALTDVSATPFVYVTDHTRNITHISLQDEWKITTKLRATFGVRHDYYSDFGATTNPRVGLNYQFSRDVAFKVSAGSAFRAPSFTDLYVSNNPAGLGNASLRPETVNMLDAGVTATLPFAEQLQVGASVFRYEAKRIIRFVAQPVTGIQVAQNAGSHDGTGVELNGQWRWSGKFTTDAHYTYIDERDAAGQPDSTVARQTAYLGGQWRLSDRGKLHLGARWVAERSRALGDPRPPIADYVWGTARLEHKFGRLTASLAVENLFDQNAKEPSNGSIPDDYPLAVRQWILGASWEF